MAAVRPEVANMLREYKFEMVRDATDDERGLIRISGFKCGGCPRIHHIPTRRADKLRDSLEHDYELEFAQGIIKNKQLTLGVEFYGDGNGDPDPKLRVMRVKANYPLVGLVIQGTKGEETINVLGYAVHWKSPIQPLTPEQLQVCHSVADDYPDLRYNGEPF